MTMDTLQPIPAVIAEITPLIRDNHIFSFHTEQELLVPPGAFIEITVPGVGNFPVSTCGPVANGRIVACIRRAGRVTDALYRLRTGDRVGIRGPYGQGFPVEAFGGRDALLIAGGLGMAPLRGLLMALLEEQARVDKIILLYGSREPEQLLFRDELLSLAQQKKIELRFSVDFTAVPPAGLSGVICRVGLVNELLQDLAFEPAQTVAAVCGPPALYGCVLEELATMGIPAERIYATLERRMRCGIGECCHCVTAGRFVCRDGPVFSLQELQAMPGAI